MEILDTCSFQVAMQAFRPRRKHIVGSSRSGMTHKRSRYDSPVHQRETKVPFVIDYCENLVENEWEYGDNDTAFWISMPFEIHIIRSIPAI